MERPARDPPQEDHVDQMPPLGANRLADQHQPVHVHPIAGLLTELAAGGSLQAQPDGTLAGARWQPLEALLELEIYPPVGAELLACAREDFAGEVRYLGNVWVDAGSPPPALP
ncbi:MAG: hypothetical protein NVSMB29_16870 [Candidatus Dormibacteria bacterium]